MVQLAWGLGESSWDSGHKCLRHMKADLETITRIVYVSVNANTIMRTPFLEAKEAKMSRIWLLFSVASSL